MFGMGTGGATSLWPPGTLFPFQSPALPLGRAGSMSGSGRGIRTPDLRVMSPTSYHCSIPRRPTIIALDEDRQEHNRTEKPGHEKVRVIAAKAAKPSTISTGKLHALQRFHLQPIEQVVFLRSYPVNPVGSLILRPASHLDAFSAYPFRTWLPGSAPGGTTGTPEVRSPRSSRTRGNSSQASCAHSG